MNRRQFIAGVGAAAIAPALPVSAPQTVVWHWHVSEVAYPDGFGGMIGGSENVLSIWGDLEYDGPK